MGEDSLKPKDNKVDFEQFKAASLRRSKLIAEEREQAGTVLDIQFVRDKTDFKVIAEDALALARGRVNRQIAKMREILRAVEKIGVPLEVGVKVLPASDMLAVTADLNELGRCTDAIGGANSKDRLNTLQLHFADLLGMINQDLDKKDEALNKPSLTETLSSEVLQKFNGFHSRLDAIKSSLDSIWPGWFTGIQGLISEFESKIKLLNLIPNTPSSIDISMDLQERIEKLDKRIERAEKEVRIRLEKPKEE